MDSPSALFSWRRRGWNLFHFVRNSRRELASSLEASCVLDRDGDALEEWPLALSSRLGSGRLSEVPRGDFPALPRASARLTVLWEAGASSKVAAAVGEAFPVVVLFVLRSLDSLQLLSISNLLWRLFWRVRLPANGNLAAVSRTHTHTQPTVAGGELWNWINRASWRRLKRDSHRRRRPIERRRQVGCRLRARPPCSTCEQSSAGKLSASRSRAVSLRAFSSPSPEIGKEIRPLGQRASSPGRRLLRASRRSGKPKAHLLTLLANLKLELEKKPSLAQPPQRPSLCPESLSSLISHHLSSGRIS